jgi:uncharacterized membrane protein
MSIVIVTLLILFLLFIFYYIFKKNGWVDWLLTFLIIFLIGLALVDMPWVNYPLLITYVLLLKMILDIIKFFMKKDENTRSIIKKHILINFIFIFIFLILSLFQPKISNPAEDARDKSLVNTTE